MDEKINWNSTYHNDPKMKFVIPVGKLTRKETEELLRELMKSYKEPIEIDENDLIINNKDIWFPKKSDGM